VFADEFALVRVLGQGLLQDQGRARRVPDRPQDGGQFLGVLRPAGVQADGAAQEREGLDEAASSGRLLALAEGAAGL